jgi:hypothetical protein
MIDAKLQTYGIRKKRLAEHKRLHKENMGKRALKSLS